MSGGFVYGFPPFFVFWPGLVDFLGWFAWRFWAFLSYFVIFYGFLCYILLLALLGGLVGAFRYKLGAAFRGLICDFYLDVKGCGHLS